ncbi:VOC family protein [Candidatus Poriferisocius sp.]|uniref:VOC family protein n=1 Tax=Candidatus Poriferisocius sp. TaxID=3101276 RepID=UPI003B5C680C
MSEKVNHVGLAVADLDAEVSFWTRALGFEQIGSLDADDAPTGRLLGLKRPGLRAVYLRRGEFVLELLSFRGAGLVNRPNRVMNEPGLTHLSLNVADLDAAAQLVQTHGGEVLVDTRLGNVAVMIRTPGQQLVELLVGFTPPTHDPPESQP